ISINGTLNSTGGLALIDATAGDLTLDGDVNAAAQTLPLDASGAINQPGGSIAAATLTGSAGGAISLPQTANAVAAIGNLSAGARFSLVDNHSTGLTLNAGDTLSGGSAGVSLTNAGPISINGTLNSTGGLALIDATAGDLTLDGDVNAAAQPLPLDASGAINQTGGSIAAATLTGSAGGAISLPQTANAVAAIGNLSAGAGFTLVDNVSTGLTHHTR